MKEYLPKRQRIIFNYYQKLTTQNYNYLRIHRPNDFEKFLSRDDSSSFVQYARNEINNNQSLFLLITAAQGTGKTLAAYYLAYLLNLKIQLITSQTSFLGFCELQPTRHFVFFPDLTTLITSRQFNSKLGKNLQQTIQNIRFLSNVYVATIPNFSSAEKTFRQVFTECPLIKAQNKRLLHLPLDNYFVIDIPELDEKFRLNVLIDDLKAKKEYLSSLGSTLKF